MLSLFIAIFLQLVENSVCLLRNLSYQVHREIPGCERYAEAAPINQGPPPTSKGGCFGSRKGKGQYRTVIKAKSSTVSDRLAAQRQAVAGLFELAGGGSICRCFFTLPLFPLFFSFFFFFSPSSSSFLSSHPPSCLPVSLLCLDEWFSKGKIFLLAFS